MQRVFLGSEALATGELTRHGLVRWHRRVYPGVYVPKGQAVTLADRVTGAWLWSGRRAVIAGVAAAAVHGAQWVDVDTPVELVTGRTRSPRGIVVRNEVLAAGEITDVAGLTVTTVVRTAFDLARHQRRGRALERLDALMRAVPFVRAAVLELARAHPGARGLVQLRELLPLVDGGAESPRETWLRLLLIDAGFPIPTTQIPVYRHGRRFAVLDMGWEDFRVSAEYDGELHRTLRRSYVKDQYRERVLPRLGWINIRVIKEDTESDIIDRVAQALWSRGWRGRPVYPARLR